MKTETYKVTVNHDKGDVTLTVVSLSGEQGVIQQVTTAEGCPKCAIVDIVKVDSDAKQQVIKAKNIDKAKSMASLKSLEMQYKDEPIYIIYCYRTKYYYVTTDSLIRNWERLIGYYENGIYHKENQVNK